MTRISLIFMRGLAACTVYMPALLTFTAAGPFFIGMIIVYTTFTIWNEGYHGEDPTIQLVSILHKPYPDQYFYTYSGTGIIVGDDIVLTVPEALEYKEENFQKRKITDRYFISSGSTAWLRREGVMNIERVTQMNDWNNHNSFSVMVVKVAGSFSPKVTSLKNWLTAKSASNGSTYKVHGWNNNVDSTKAKFETVEATFPFSWQNCLNMTGGVMFDGASFVGFSRLTCGQNRTKFVRSYSPVSNFVVKLLKAYPNVKLRLGSGEFEDDALPTTTLVTRTMETTTVQLIESTSTTKQKDATNQSTS